MRALILAVIVLAIACGDESAPSDVELRCRELAAVACETLAPCVRVPTHECLAEVSGWMTCTEAVLDPEAQAQCSAGLRDIDCDPATQRWTYPYWTCEGIIED